MCTKLNNFSPGMARPFKFAALCLRAHPLKHSLAEKIFVNRVQKTAKKSSLVKNSLAESLVSRGILYLEMAIGLVNPQQQYLYIYIYIYIYICGGT